MPDILSPTGIEKPFASELHSRAMVNRNYDRSNQIAIDSIKQAGGLQPTPKYNTTASANVSDGIIENFASFTFKGGRKYEITWEGDWQMDTAANYFELSINTCSTADPSTQLTGLTVLDSGTLTCNAINAAEHFRVSAFIEPVSDTTVQVKFRLKRAVGGGLAKINGSSTAKAKYTIIDQGANY